MAVSDEFVESKRPQRDPKKEKILVFSITWVLEFLQQWFQTTHQQGTFKKVAYDYIWNNSKNSYFLFETCIIGFDEVLGYLKHCWMVTFVHPHILLYWLIVTNVVYTWPDGSMGIYDYTTSIGHNLSTLIITNTVKSQVTVKLLDLS